MLRFFAFLESSKELSFLQIPHLSLLSRTLNVWKIRLGSAPCCKGNDEHHYQEWNGELVGRNTIQGHTCKHHARYEEWSDGSSERIHRTGEVHALHRLGSRQG